MGKEEGGGEWMEGEGGGGERREKGAGGRERDWRVVSQVPIFAMQIYWLRSKYNTLIVNSFKELKKIL